MRKPLRVIAYDIADPRRLRKVEVLISSFAERVQDSVYEAALSEEQLSRLLMRTRKLIEETADSVRVYTLCGSCEKSVLRLGTGGMLLPEIVIV